DLTHECGRGLSGLVAPEAYDDREPVTGGQIQRAVDPTHQRLCVEWNGHVETSADIGPEESGCRYTHDGEGDRVEPKRLSEDGRGATVAALPEIVADNGHG